MFFQWWVQGVDVSLGATPASSIDVVPLSIVLVRSKIAGVEEQVPGSWPNESQILQGVGSQS